MSAAPGPWARRVARLRAQEPGTALALVRIFLGLTLLVDLIDIGLSGALELLWMPPEAGGLFVPKASGALARVLEATPDNIWLVYGGTLAATAGDRRPSCGPPRGHRAALPPQPLRARQRRP